MLSPSPGDGSPHYNPDQPRDSQGRWTGDASFSKESHHLSTLDPVGRANLLLGHARLSARLKGYIHEFKQPTQNEAQRFSRVLAAWNTAADLSDKDFRDRFAPGLVDSLSAIRRLRQAAADAAKAQTFDQMIDAGKLLASAVKDASAYSWPSVLERLEDQAENVGIPDNLDRIGHSDTLQLAGDPSTLDPRKAAYWYGLSKNDMRYAIHTIKGEYGCRGDENLTFYKSGAIEVNGEDAGMIGDYCR